jgi:hypothetical protein
MNKKLSDNIPKELKQVAIFSFLIFGGTGV